MRQRNNPSVREDEYEPRNYWEEIARTYAGNDPLAAVCYADAPPWFNRFFAKFQVKAIEESMKRCVDVQRPLAALVVDVGCGTGRWSSWLSRRYQHVLGIDASETMARQARNLHPQVSFLNGCGEALPLRTEAVALVLSVTVIQHIPRHLQGLAIAEMARVLKPGGMAVCVELTDSHAVGRHVFPNPLDRWIDMFREQGLKVILVKGQGYALLLRGAARLASLLPARLLGRQRPDAQVVLTERVKLSREQRRPLTAASVGSLKGPLAIAARILVWISYPLEHLFSRFMGPRFAQHALFIFVKAERGQVKGER